MSRPRNKRKNFKAGPPAAVNRGDFFKEVSTVNSYLYFTRPYPFNPDSVIGKKGIKTYTEIYRDEQVKAAMLSKQFAVISPGWEIQPAQYEKDSEKTQAEEVAGLVEQSFDGIEGAFENKLLEMLSAFVYGFSVCEKVFYLIDKGEYSGKIGIKDLKFRNPEGFDFQTDPFGNLLPEGVLQAVKPLPAEKFMIYSYRKRFSNYYGDSDLREVYRPFWAKDNLIKFMMICMERYGEPTWVFTAKGAQTKANVSTLENFMRDIQSKSGLILPDTIEAKPEYPAPQAGAAYLQILEYLDGLIRAALGMPSLIGASTTESQTGSLARSQTQMDMFINLMEYLRADVESNINEQVVKQLVDFNFEITDNYYPQFKFKAINAEEEQRQFDNYMKGLTSKAITKSRDDEIFFREKLEIPALPDDYPVSGEITPEMQKEQDTQAKEVHDATIANMEAKAAAPSGGGFPPKTAKAAEDDEAIEYAWDELKHPRHEKGDERGGEFAPKEGAAVHKSISAAESKLVNQGREHLVAFSPDGKELLRVKGGKNSVSIDIDEGSKLPKNVIVTHNHPNGMSFSPDDFAFAALHDVAQMRVVTDSGTFSLRRPGAGWPASWRTLEGTAAVEKEFMAAAKPLRAKYNSLIAEKRLTLKRAQHSMLHEVIAGVAKRRGMKYGA